MPDTPFTYSRDQDVRLLEDALAAGKDVCARVSEGPYSNEWLDALAALDRIVAGSRSLEEQFDALRTEAQRAHDFLDPQEVARYPNTAADNARLVLAAALNPATNASEPVEATQGPSTDGNPSSHPGSEASVPAKVEG